MTNSIDCEKRNAAFAELIEAVMDQKGISVRRLVQEGVIAKGHRVGFAKRLRNGTITFAEFQGLVAYLEIDQVRAALVVNCLHSSTAYFEPTCVTSADLASELCVQMSTEMAACEGSFEPLRKSLCKSIAAKTTSDIARHHVSLNSYRDGASHFQPAAA